MIKGAGRGNLFRPFLLNVDFDLSFVMPGLVPGIHVFLDVASEDVDGRAKSAERVFRA